MFIWSTLSILQSFKSFFPKRYQSGLIKSIVYPWVCEDVPYGKMSRPWPMPGPQRARPAGPEHANSRSQPDRSWTSISRHFLFENRALVDFTERKWRPWGWSWWKWLFYLQEMDLEAISYLKIHHWSIFKKEISESDNSARPRCDFIYTKNSARPGSGFYLHKE